MLFHSKGLRLLWAVVRGPSQVAIHGLAEEQFQKGFTLTCQTYPCGPGLEVELGKYDQVYEEQVGVHVGTFGLGERL
jgi:hypothetical protein